VFLGMSWSQNISVLLLLAGMALWRIVRRGRTDLTSRPHVAPTSLSAT
jgi:hypothetical protein